MGPFLAIILNIKTVKARIEAHLQRLASEIGSRSIGTAENAAAFDYILEVVGSGSARVSVHETKVELRIVDEWSCSAEIAGNREDVAILPGVSTLPLEPVPMPVAPRIYACLDDLRDFPPEPGSLAVMAGGNFHESDACALAQPAIAVAWFREGHPGLFSGTCERMERHPAVPGFAVDEQTARMWVAESAVVTARISTQVRDIAIRNVIADVGVADSMPCFVAHYDSKPMCPGANDNASGVAVLLAMLESWRSDRPARFVFFDGEEAGMLGSLPYVEMIKSEGRLSEFQFVVCPDSVGLGELHLYTADRFGPFPDALLNSARRAFAEMEMPVGERAARSGSSDYLPFHELGVPCLFLSDFPNHVRHTTEDLLELVDHDVLAKLALTLTSESL